MVHLICFYTEGPPHDNGRRYTNVKDDFLKECSRAPFDSITAFSPRALLSGDPSWEETLADYREAVRCHELFSDELRWNIEWAALGLSGWRPRLCREIIDGAKYDGEIVLYHDVDVARYPDYRLGVAEWPEWVEESLGKSDLLFFTDDLSLQKDTKQENLDFFFPEGLPDGLAHVWAGAFAFRVGSVASQFFAEWEALHRDFDLVSPLTKYPEKDGFYWNSPNQATLGPLLHQKLIAMPDFPVTLISLGRSRQIPPKSE